MAQYALTTNQAAALRALNEGVVELSSTEVAVNALLLPDQARAALAYLERLGLVSSWIPVTGRTGENLFVLTGEGQAVCRALAQHKEIPPVGTIVRSPRSLPSFAEWLSRQTPSYVEIVSEK